MELSSIISFTTAQVLARRRWKTTHSEAFTFKGWCEKRARQGISSTLCVVRVLASKLYLLVNWSIRGRQYWIVSRALRTTFKGLKIVILYLILLQSMWHNDGSSIYYQADNKYTKVRINKLFLQSKFSSTNSCLFQVFCADKVANLNTKHRILLKCILFSITMNNWPVCLGISDAAQLVDLNGFLAVITDLRRKVSSQSLRDLFQFSSLSCRRRRSQLCTQALVLLIVVVFYSSRSFTHKHIVFHRKFSFSTQKWHTRMVWSVITNHGANLQKSSRRQPRGSLWRWRQQPRRFKKGKQGLIS